MATFQLKHKINNSTELLIFGDMEELENISEKYNINISQKDIINSNTTDNTIKTDNAIKKEESKIYKKEINFIDIDIEFGKEKINEWINFYKSLNINSAMNNVIISIYWTQNNIDVFKNGINIDYIYSFLRIVLGNIKFNLPEAIGNARRKQWGFIKKEEDGKLSLTMLGRMEIENNILKNKE
ncbi:hypothetical protein [Brachyspira hyodysenteriae]|uniref:hypothetical protein n=1 Tax=Brachyspira hyodysenteriae TaxID=159 RepID=UPI0011831211|nr:hypothetical protein [Brachyspira hyodysenteriae]TVL44585.1 hypothetical protein A9X73_12700 [Brachyspira hyodysenteriae]